MVGGYSSAPRHKVFYARAVGCAMTVGAFRGEHGSSGFSGECRTAKRFGRARELRRFLWISFLCLSASGSIARVSWGFSWLLIVVRGALVCDHVCVCDTAREGRHGELGRRVKI